VGKNKLAKWEELLTFTNVIQLPAGTFSGHGHYLKGKWGYEVFRNDNPLVLELGCGKGEYTTGLSGIFKNRNFIGVDIKGARLWRGARTSHEEKSKNVAFLRTRIEFIDSFFAEDEVDEIWITFPDPHSGKKNSNKRLTCPWFINKYRSFIKDRAIIHLKTDNDELYTYTLRVIKEFNFDVLLSTEDLYGSYPAEKDKFCKLYSTASGTKVNEEAAEKIISIQTHYEKLFRKEGLKIFYLAFRIRKDEKSI
jgi:tRNA (guanine-N7-)-methyltransferase